MPLITHTAQLNAGTELVINTSARTISLVIAGNLSTAGVTLQCLYSKLKELWKTDSALIPYPFPMTAITPEQFEFNFGWKPLNTLTRNLIRTGGWAEYDVSNILTRKYLGVVTLGTIQPGDTAYYAFASDTARTAFTYAGPVNEAVQVYGDAANGDFNHTAEVLSVYVRTQAQTFSKSTSTVIGLASLTNNVARFPLSEGIDLNITHSDVTIAGTAPYTGMSITYFAAPQAKVIGGSSYNYGIVIEANGGTTDQVYEFVQYKLRQNADIDAGAGTVNGYLADPLLIFVGTDLKTLSANNPSGGGTGVFINNFDANATNSITQTDSTGTGRTYPFVAAGTISFNSNLQADASASYWMFYEYSSRAAPTDLVVSGVAGSNATITSAGNGLPVIPNNAYVNIQGLVAAGNNGIWRATALGTTGSVALTKIDGGTPVNAASHAATVDLHPINSPDAIVVNDGAGVPITGLVGAAASVSFTYAYDSNVQGGRTASTDAPVALRAIGLNSAQYIEADSTITRQVGINFSLVSSLERNYMV